MSSMLSQAVLDAKDLKEAAIKNAQQTLIEKYSSEYEKEIEKLLEQVDPAAAIDPMAPMTPAVTAASSPVDAEVARSDSDAKSDIFEKLEYAFKDGEVIEDKAYPTGMVEIDLDSLSEFGFKKNQVKNPDFEALQELKMLSKKRKLYENEDFEGEEYDDDDDDDDDLGASDKCQKCEEECECVPDEDGDDFKFEIVESDDPDENEDIDDDDKCDKCGKVSDECECSAGKDSELDEDLESLLESLLESAEEPTEELEEGHKPTLAQELISKLENLESKMEKKNHPGYKAEVSSLITLAKKIGAEDKKLKESIRLDWKRTGPRSKWTGMNHEEAEHDVELANLQSQIEEMEQETDSLKESKIKLKTGLKESLKVIEAMSAENSSLSKKARQYEEKLHESRVLNYKLLYTNKVLANSSLNERQKTKIAESISNAKTTEEVKLLYETLNSTMREGTMNTSPKSLSEAVERRSSSSVLLKGAQKEPSRRDDYAERMKLLAGIK